MHWFRRIVLGAAFTTGYVLGARAGRRRYEQIATWWHGVMNAPVAKEAWRRFRNDEIKDNEFYCSEAQMAGIFHRNRNVADGVHQPGEALVR